MGISPNRAEKRLASTVTAIKTIANLEDKIKGWLEDQDQRQVQVTLLDNQISDLKGTLIPEKIDSPPNAENAVILERIGTIEQQKAQIVVLYDQTSTLLNKATAELESMRKANPHATSAAVIAQEAALARKQAAYPRLLLRHLYKCKAHGWADARMAKLTEHRTAIRAERQKLAEKVVTADLADIEAHVLATTPTEQLAEALRQ